MKLHKLDAMFFYSQIKILFGSKYTTDKEKTYDFHLVFINKKILPNSNRFISAPCEYGIRLFGVNHR